MSIENPFEKPPQKQPEDDKIQGEGFTMGGTSRYPRTESAKINVEFRPGESSDEKIKEMEKKDEERRRQREEERERELKMTPEEKVAREKERKLQHEQVNREVAYEWFETFLQKKGIYSETLLIEKDGTFNKQRRLDGNIPYLTLEADLNDTNDLYKFMQSMSQEYPELNISFENDPEGKWIKYIVIEKSKEK